MQNKQTHTPDTRAPRPLLLGSHPKDIMAGSVQVAVHAKKAAWTFRALVSLASSMMSMMSRQFQHIAHVRACARVSITFYFDIYFQIKINCMDIMDEAYRNNNLAWTFRMDGLGHHGRCA